MVDVLACMFFGGVSGSCVADVSAIGAIMIPMMKEKVMTMTTRSELPFPCCSSVLVPQAII